MPARVTVGAAQDVDVKHAGEKVSLAKAGVHKLDALVWGFYTSSGSSKEETVAMSDFTHRLRTTLSRVWFAKRGEPLFLRHARAPKRSVGEGGSRTDPTKEVETLRLNPFYKEKGRLLDKNVVVVDDFATHGVSMGVAAGFLRSAGALSVTCVAIGKFGGQLRCYDLKVTGDPYQPVTAGQWSFTQAAWSDEQQSTEDQAKLRQMLLG